MGEMRTAKYKGTKLVVVVGNPPLVCRPEAPIVGHYLASNLALGFLEAIVKRHTISCITLIIRKEAHLFLWEQNKAFPNFESNVISFLLGILFYMAMP